MKILPKYVVCVRIYVPHHLNTKNILRLRSPRRNRIRRPQSCNACLSIRWNIRAPWRGCMPENVSCLDRNCRFRGLYISSFRGCILVGSRPRLDKSPNDLWACSSPDLRQATRLITFNVATSYESNRDLKRSQANNSIYN